MSLEGQENRRSYLVVDLEATCSQDGKIVPREKMEIIEIGAVLVDGDGYHVTSEFGRVVRPVRTPVLTQFCRELTGITQEEVDQADIFPTVLAEFRRWINEYPGAVFASWGNYDRVQFQRDCAHHGVEYPFGPEHFNVKTAFRSKRALSRSIGMAAALRSVGLRLEGRHHRGLDDARNIARLLPFVLDRTPDPRQDRRGC